MTARDLRPASLALRAAIVVIGLLLAWLTFASSWAGATRSGAPDSALAVAPFDAGARATAATRLMLSKPSPESAQQAAVLARAALTRDASSVPALRALGLSADMRGDVATAARLFGAVERRSRRDLLSQLWLVERRTQMGDIPGSLRYYERTLDAINDSQSVLLPVLANATSDPTLTGPIGDMLARNRGKAWWPQATRSLVQSSPDPARAAPIALRVLDPRDLAQRETLAVLLNRIGEAKAYDVGALVYRRLRGGVADAGAVGQRAFTESFEEADEFVPFGWALAGEGDFSAARETAPDGRNTVLGLTAYSGRGGDIAKRLIGLAPGRYRLSYRSGNLPEARDERPSVALACVDRAADVLTSVTASGAQTVGEVVVPAGCTRQWLVVRMAGSGIQPVQTPWIDQLGLSRISG